MSKLLQKRSIKSVWAILLLFMVICCSGVLTTWIVAKRTAKSALDAKLKELQSNGVPIDDESMTAYHHSLSSDENAAQWASIIDTMSSKDFTADYVGLPIVSPKAPPIPAIDQPWNEQQMVEQFLSKHADTISSLIELAQNNGPVRMPIKFNSVATLLPHAQNSRNAVRVLQLEAHVAARQKDTVREYRAINAMFGCSFALRGEPTMISQLVGIAIHAMALGHLQNAVQHNRLRPDHYELLSNRLDKLADIRQPFTIGLIGELGLMTNAMREPALLRDQFGNWTPLLTETGISERAALKHALYLEEAMQANVDDLQAFRNHLQEMETRHKQTQSKFSLDSHISAMFTPALSGFSTAVIRHKMANDTARLAIAIRLYEHRHGKLPDSLTDLESAGLNLQQFKAVDGNLPMYQLVVPGSQPNLNCRALLWSFDCRTEKTISPKPPAITTSQDPSEFWWYWEL